MNRDDNDSASAEDIPDIADDQGLARWITLNPTGVLCRLGVAKGHDTGDFVLDSLS